MARIAFFPLAEIGHTNATFGLARRLRARGHDVIYLSLADVQDHVRAQGFEFIPFFEDVFQTRTSTTLKQTSRSERRQSLLGHKKAVG